MLRSLSAAFRNSLKARAASTDMPLERRLPLLEDRPCTLKDGPADVYGQNIARETLKTLIIEALTHVKLESCIVALLGRYGQGKSTVLHQLEESLTQDRAENYHPPTIRFRGFDVAAAQVDSLLFAFDALIGNWSLRRRLLMTAGSALMLSFTILIMFHYVPMSFWKRLTPVSQNQNGMLVAFGVPTALALTILKRPLLRAWLFVVAAIRDTGSSQAWAKLRSEWNAGSFAAMRNALRDLLGGRPDVLLIDNLDRASTDQQRAFLQAIRRHRHALPRVVIVAFDETPLLLSDDRPDTPLEILSKTFTTTVRLTPELPSDVVAVILQSIVALAETSPQFGMLLAEAKVSKKLSAEPEPQPIEVAFELLQCSRNVTRHFVKPSVLGDLVRVLSLQRRHSFRFCKQFISVLMTRAHTLRLEHPDDLSAFIRLEGLRTHVPWILDDPETLASLLDMDRADALIIYAEQVARRKLTDEERLRAEKFLRATRHMRPTQRGWRDLLSRPGLASAETQLPDLRLDPVSLVEWLVWNQHFAAIDDPLRRAEAYCMALRDPLGNERPRARESIWSAEPLASFIRLPDLGSNEQQKLTLCRFGALVHRIWYADPDFPAQKAFLRLDHTEPFALRKDWIQAILPVLDGTASQTVEAARSILLQALPAAHPDFVGSLAAASMIAASGEVRRDEAMLRAWFERMDITPPEDSDFFPQLLGQTLSSTDTAIVFRAWPMIPRAKSAADLDFAFATKICGTLGLLHRRQCRASADVLRSWLVHVAEIDDQRPAVAQGVITAVAALFPRFAPGLDQGWDLSPVEWIADLDHSGALWQDWLERLDLFALRRRPDIWAIVFIAILAGARDTVERLVKDFKPPAVWDLGWIAGLEAALTSPTDRSGVMADAIHRGLSGFEGRRLLAGAIRAARQSRDPIRLATARAVVRRLRSRSGAAAPA